MTHKTLFGRLTAQAFRRSLMVTLALVAVLNLLTACDNDDDDDDANELQNIVTIAQGNDSFDLLEEALLRFPDLVTTLSGTTEYTVFAPTDEAFQGLLTALGKENLSDLPDGVLRDVLEYHVVTGAVLSGQVQTGAIPTVGGENIDAVVNGSNIVLNGNTNVTTPFDVEASNGVIHSIDAVLIPPTIQPVVGTVVGVAFFNPDFTTLVAALQKANLVNTLLDNDPITVFAPTNQAFTDAGIDVDALSAEQLAPVLAYHVIGSGAVRAGNLSDNLAVEMFDENNTYIDLVGTSPFINGISITDTDIEGSNGVVHVISGVLTPPAGDIVATAQATANEFTLLEAAIVRASLVMTLQGPGPLTVFAPTDQAFIDAGFTEAVINETDPQALADILTYHVVEGRVLSPDVMAGNVPTVNTATFEVVINGSTITLVDNDANSPDATVVSTDIVTTNGVIHVIDKVILP